MSNEFDQTQAEFDQTLSRAELSGEGDVDTNEAIPRGNSPVPHTSDPDSCAELKEHAASDPKRTMSLLPSSQQLCLFLDVDGTLVDLAARPEDVSVPLGLIDDLVAAADRVGGALALISGRSIASIDRLFKPLRFRAAGVHGAELRRVNDGPTEMAEIVSLPADLRARLCNLADVFPGTLAEDKKASVALHYRGRPDLRDELMQAIAAELVREADPTLVVLPGHFVFDVKRKGYNKGTALASFMRMPPFKGRTPLVIGDDVTDEYAFRAALRLGGYAFSVARQVPGVTGLFESPTEVREWLKRQRLDAEEAQARKEDAPDFLSPELGELPARRVAGG